MVVVGVTVNSSSTSSSSEREGERGISIHNVETNKRAKSGAPILVNVYCSARRLNGMAREREGTNERSSKRANKSGSPGK